jgi:hypothetical protein
LLIVHFREDVVASRYAMMAVGDGATFELPRRDGLVSLQDGPSAHLMSTESAMLSP